MTRRRQEEQLPKPLHAMEELLHKLQLHEDLCLPLHLDVAQCVGHMNVPEEEEETHHLILANLVLSIVEVQVSREPRGSLLTSRQAKHLTRTVSPSRSPKELESRMLWMSTHRSSTYPMTCIWGS